MKKKLRMKVLLSYWKHCCVLTEIQTREIRTLLLTKTVQINFLGPLGLGVPNFVNH
jgi:hypothetical protein